VESKIYSGQFILTQDNDVPHIHSIGQWKLQTDLPVYKFETGCVIGNPLPIPKSLNSIEDFYGNTFGRYIVIINDKLYLDPYGSLTAVYSNDMVASTPTLIPGQWDSNIADHMGMPQSGLWYPSGITSKKNATRLLPNHYLDLNTMESVRHWPTENINDDNNIEKNLNIIIQHIKQAINLAIGLSPLRLPITAGRDSRMLIACAKEHSEKIKYFTQSGAKETVDQHIATLIKKRFRLDHEIILIKYADKQELSDWLDRTGHSVSGAIWKIHPTFKTLSKDRLSLFGIGGEVGRAFYWKSTDCEHTKISARELLDRAFLPINDRLLTETEKWVSELSGLNTFNILDLFYIEQRLGCWAGPQHYGGSKFTLGYSPFNHRNIFTSMLSLPYEYRIKQRLAKDVIKSTWPELLRFPFNEFTGIKKQIYHARLAYRFMKRIIRPSPRTPIKKV
jgi:hypothetical protein